MSSQKIAAGFLSGIAIGVIAGMLYAPDEGNKIRRKLIQKGGDLSEALRWSATTIKEALNKEYKEIKDDVEGLGQSMSNEAIAGT